MSSKSERLVFSGREHDFLYFAEQCEARMHSLRLCSFERPQLHKLMAQLTSLRKTSSKIIVDYLTRADDMQYNLTLVNEGISEKMFDSIILKGPPKEYDNFGTLVKYSKDEKTLEKN